MKHVAADKLFDCLEIQKLGSVCLVKQWNYSTYNVHFTNFGFYKIHLTSDAGRKITLSFRFSSYRLEDCKILYIN